MPYGYYFQGKLLPGNDSNSGKHINESRQICFILQNKSLIDLMRRWLIKISGISDNLNPYCFPGVNMVDFRRYYYDSVDADKRPMV